MSAEERQTKFRVRQNELDQLASELRAKARKAWKKPASFAISLAGAACTAISGNPLGALLTVGGATLGYNRPNQTDLGAYSYLFRARNRNP
jgi:hypothetical protein